ncbi:MAG: phenylalanine--tRNA ligase subunit beta [Bacteroidales bacterium]|nr:phenylalanine--tRNA ligase subunit beta [Bacteroidales bacterium]
MKISLNWLKELINIDKPLDEIVTVLTDIGLEVAGTETFYPVKGGLKGLVIGKVLEAKKHENSDHLSVTKVDVGGETPLDIVCGAPNVVTGQKVVVATVGTVLYDGDDEFKIKKSKIRGAVSEGMICAEDEIGLGTSHDGIMVLDEGAAVGQPVAEYFDIKPDTVIEIDLTPNRIDAASHYGVARDLYAYYHQFDDVFYTLKKRTVDFKTDNQDLPVEIKIENTDACKRYSGVTINNITVKESPDWLKNKLKAIGLNPINNVVDITNFVLHETGQPLHSFDVAKITGRKVIVKTLSKGTKFKTLDETVRSLDEDDLMICNESEPMCMAGVLGGFDSGITENTKAVFLESAYFNPVYIRKSAKRHGINSDASFRFERGTDPNNTIYPLQMAAMLIKELADGEIAMNIQDVYPEKINNRLVKIIFSSVNSLIGKEIPRPDIKNLLKGLEISIEAEKEKSLLLSIPTYRVDVTREADVVEEILRLYGYNNVEIPEQVKSVLSFYDHPDTEKVKNIISDILVAKGFFEIMNNSLSAESFYDDLTTYPAEKLTKIKNPLSNELNIIRQTLLFGFLQSIQLNVNRKKKDIRFFEFGNVYQFDKNSELSTNSFREEMHLGLVQVGQFGENTWDSPVTKYDFFTLKSVVGEVLSRFGIRDFEFSESVPEDIFTYGLTYLVNNKPIVSFGAVKNELLQKFDIDKEVYFSEFNWTAVFELLKDSHIKFKPLRKFPEVQRDLSLLIDKQIAFDEIYKAIENTDKRLIKQISLFDIFENEKIGQNKKSYAVRIILQDERKTLSDKEINKLMNKIIKNLTEKVGADIR